MEDQAGQILEAGCQCCCPNNVWCICWRLSWYFCLGHWNCWLSSCVQHPPLMKWLKFLNCQAWKNSSPAKKRSLKRLLSESEDPGADPESLGRIGVIWFSGGIWAFCFWICRYIASGCLQNCKKESKCLLALLPLFLWLQFLCCVAFSQIIILFVFFFFVDFILTFVVYVISWLSVWHISVTKVYSQEAPWDPGSRGWRGRKVSCVSFVGGESGSVVDGARERERARDRVSESERERGIARDGTRESQREQGMEWEIGWESERDMRYFFVSDMLCLMFWKGFLLPLVSTGVCGRRRSCVLGKAVTLHTCGF